MKNCESGCKHFMCGSIGHHKDCVNYKDSMQNMIDNKNYEIELLKEELKKQSSMNANNIFEDLISKINLKIKNAEWNK